MGVDAPPPAVDTMKMPPKMAKVSKPQNLATFGAFVKMTTFPEGGHEDGHHGHLLLTLYYYERKW